MASLFAYLKELGTSSKSIQPPSQDTQTELIGSGENLTVKELLDWLNMLLKKDPSLYHAYVRVSDGGYLHGSSIAKLHQKDHKMIVLQAL